MAEDKENFEQENSTVINDFRRKLSTAEDRGEHAERSMKAYLKQALTGSKMSIAKDILKATKENPSKFRGGEFGNNLINEPDPTGFEEKVWERSDD